MTQMQLTEGQFLAIQTTPKSTGKPYIKKRSFDYSEIDRFCNDQNYMSDYSFFNVFVVRNGAIYEARSSRSIGAQLEWDED